MTKKQKLHHQKRKITASNCSQKRTTKGQKIRSVTFVGLVEKVPANNNHIVRLNTDKTQILHRIRLGKYNPEKPPEDNYQEAKGQIDDYIVAPKDDLYTNA